MIKKLSMLLLVSVFVFASGCSSTLEEVNKGAEGVGKTGGQIMRVPMSASGGAAARTRGLPSRS